MVRVIVRGMEDTLLSAWLGKERHCPDCGTLTVFWPVDGDDWVCISCDGAVSMSVTAA